VFIDSDVVVTRSAIDRLSDIFANEPDVAAVFGAYDEEPAERNFISQYKNLSHSFIHQSSSAVAHTFWAGFGAVRADVFAEVGGFDERFTRPCIEDIDLGYRLTAAGHVVRLDHELRACHLKRWTWRSMIQSDVFDRGIPWTQLILRFGRFSNDLNLKSGYRACVVLSYLLPMALAASFLSAWFLMLAAAWVSTLAYLGRRFYGYFMRQRGWWFAVRVFPLHYVYHLYNGFSFLTGSSLYLAVKWFNVSLPGALPITPWPPSQFGPELAVLIPRRARPSAPVAMFASSSTSDTRD
jgi:hypothetical protein